MRGPLSSQRIDSTSLEGAHLDLQSIRQQENLKHEAYFRQYNDINDSQKDSELSGSQGDISSDRSEHFVEQFLKMKSKDYNEDPNQKKNII